MAEVSITDIIKQLRVLNAAAQLNLSQSQWQQLREEYEILAYSDLDSATNQTDTKDFNTKTKILDQQSNKVSNFSDLSSINISQSFIEMSQQAREANLNNQPLDLIKVKKQAKKSSRNNDKYNEQPIRKKLRESIQRQDVSSAERKPKHVAQGKYQSDKKVPISKKKPQQDSQERRP